MSYLSEKHNSKHGTEHQRFFIAVVVISKRSKSVLEALINAGQEISSGELMLGNSEWCLLWLLCIPTTAHCLPVVFLHYLLSTD